MEAWTHFQTSKADWQMYMNTIYLLGFIKQGMNFEFANSNHTASIYVEANVTLLCMHRIDIFQRIAQILKLSAAIYRGNSMFRGP